MGGKEIYSHPVMRNPEKGLVPQVFRTTFTFVESWDNTTAVPGFYDWVLRGNSIYDPDYALSADSCYGENAVAELYTVYKVLGSKITVTITNNDDDDPVNCSIIPARFPDAFAAANQDGLMLHPMSKSFTVSKLSGGKTRSNVISTSHILNVSNLDSVNYSSEFTTNPATCWYWHVVTWNNAGTASDCEMLVKVEYLTDVSGPKAFTQ